MKEFLLIGALLFDVYLWSDREITRPGGVLVPEQPVQQEIYSSLFREKTGYWIALLANFDIKVRVIAAEKYRLDRGAELSPVDLALGWGADVRQQWLYANQRFPRRALLQLVGQELSGFPRCHRNP